MSSTPLSAVLEGNIDLEMQQINGSKTLAVQAAAQVPGNSNASSQTFSPSLSSLVQLSRRDIIARRGYKVGLNEKDILKATKHHRKYTYNGTTLNGLGKYDNSCDYGISKEQEKAMIKAEVKRLIKVATQEEPFLFDSEGDLQYTDTQSFEDVSSIIDQILCNFQIIKHDNARLLLEDCPSELHRGAKDFTRSREQLIARFMQDQNQVQGYQPRMLTPPERNARLYFALVDYILGNIARLLVRSAKSNYWEVHILSTLAMWATKLKNLSYNPAYYAGLSLSDGEDIIQQTIESIASRQAFVLKIKTGSDEQTEVDALGTEFNIKTQYYFQKTSFRYLLEGCLTATANSLLRADNISSSSSCFEACTLIYRAGLEGHPTLLSNDRDGDVNASSDPSNLNCSYSAMDLLLKNVVALTKGTLPPKPPLLTTAHQPAESTAASFEWEWFDGNPAKYSLNRTWKTDRMDHLISLVVGLGMTTTYIATYIDRLIHIASNHTKEEDPIIQFEFPPKDFRALFKITTASFLEKSKTSNSPYTDIDVRPVADSPMRRNVRVGKDILQLFHKSDASTAQSQQSVAKSLADDRSIKRKMDSWVITEDAVIIKCRRYVITVIMLVIALVLGSMSIPFAVKERISGVDPFQITTFSWLLAGFITILAKSRYVSAWPWHDFLRGQVVCNGVSDVHEVTGVDPQMIIWYLLHAEHDSILRTRGPYNGMFGQVNKGDNSVEDVDMIKTMYGALFGRKGQEVGGFAIDEPVHLSTMLASGFIILKVLNDKGEHLICVDVRKGTEAAVYARLEKETFLSCMNIDKDITELTSIRKSQDGQGHFSPERKDMNDKILKLSVHEFRWNKMLGVYVQDSRFG